MPVHLIIEEELLRNTFYKRYTSDSQSLPSFTGRNSSFSTPQSFRADLSEWTNDHILACRVVPLTALPIRHVIPGEYFDHLTEFENRIIQDFERPSLEDLEYGSEASIPMGSLMVAPLLTLRSILRSEWMSGVRLAQTLMDEITWGLFDDSKLQIGEKRLKLCFCTKEHVESSVTLGGNTNWKLTLYSSIIFRDVTEYHTAFVDKEERVPVVGFYFQHAQSFAEGRRWSEEKADCRYAHEENEEKREYQRQHPESDVSSIVSTPTPPPRPSESLHLKGKDVPSPPSHAQELGMMLAQLTANSKAYGVADHEAFVIGMNHTRMHISSAFFPSEHILEAMKNAVLPTDSLVYFLQSEEFDLALPEGRTDGLKALIALFKYVLSGEAKIGRMKKFVKELKSRHEEQKQ
ncbi:hypothetical protein BT69DRAFT_1354866 [Atractiella rhizophila]|nr:hypothetical protein BT69DRAFT_1354866 [Atractiella rhizophila]